MPKRPRLTRRPPITMTKDGRQRARRLAALLLGGDGWPGVLELAVVHGPGAMSDPAVQAALRSTTHRWAAGPGAWLAGWDAPLEGIA